MDCGETIEMIPSSRDDVSPVRRSHVCVDVFLRLPLLDGDKCAGRRVGREQIVGNATWSRLLGPMSAQATRLAGAPRGTLLNSELPPGSRDLPISAESLEPLAVVEPAGHDHSGQPRVSAHEELGRPCATDHRSKHECCRNVVPGQSGRLYFVAVRPATIRTEGRCSLGASPPLANASEPLSRRRRGARPGQRKARLRGKGLSWPLARSRRTCGRGTDLR